VQQIRPEYWRHAHLGAQLLALLQSFAHDLHNAIQAGLEGARLAVCTYLAAFVVHADDGFDLQDGCQQPFMWLMRPPWMRYLSSLRVKKVWHSRLMAARRSRIFSFDQPARMALARHSLPARP